MYKIWPKFIVAKIRLQGFNDLYKDTLEKTWTDRKDRFGVRQKCKFVTKTFEVVLLLTLSVFLFKISENFKFNEYIFQQLNFQSGSENAQARRPETPRPQKARKTPRLRKSTKKKPKKKRLKKNQHPPKKKKKKRRKKK